MFDRRWKLSSLQILATDLRNFQAAMAQRVRGAKNILMCDFNSNGIMKIHSCDSWSAPLSIFFLCTVHGSNKHVLHTIACYMSEHERHLEFIYS